MIVDCGGELYNGPEIILEHRTEIKNCIFDGKRMIIRANDVVLDNVVVRNSPMDGILIDGNNSRGSGTIIRNSYFVNNNYIDIFVKITPPSNPNERVSFRGPRIEQNNFIKNQPKPVILLRIIPFENTPAVVWSVNVNNNQIRYGTTGEQAVSIEIGNSLMPMISNNTISGGRIGITVSRSIDGMVTGNNIRNVDLYAYEPISSIRTTFIANRVYNAPDAISAAQGGTSNWVANSVEGVRRQFNCSTGAVINGLCKHTLSNGLSGDNAIPGKLN